MDRTFTARITEVRKDHSIEERLDFIRVTFVILETVEDKEVEVAERKLRFDIDATEKEIKQEIKKYVETFTGDVEIGAKSEIIEKQNKKLAKITENLEGVTI